MLNIKRVIVLFTLFAYTLQCWGQALPVSNMQNAISGVMQAKMESRGFSANDPRFSATLQGTGSTIAGAAISAAVVTAAGVTAPAWVTTAVVVGLGALLSYAINLAVGGVADWLFGSGNSVTSMTTTMQGGTDSNLVPGQPYTGYTRSNGTVVFTGDLSSAMADFLLQGTAQAGMSLSGCYAVGNGQTVCGWYDKNGTYYPGFGQPVFGFPYNTSSYGGQPCAGLVIGGTCVPNYPGTPVTSSSTSNIPTAISKIPASDLAKPLNPQILADIADTAWQDAAAQPGYAGIPYDASNPITATDASNWQTANPSNWPSVNDAVSPQPAPAGGTAASPFILPNTATPATTTSPSTQSPTPTNPAASNPLDNLGPDPGIGNPALETPPDGPTIMAPLTTGLSAYMNFSVTLPAGVCPAPTLNLAPVINVSVPATQMCTIWNNIAPQVSAISTLCWSLLFLVIILSA